MPNWTLTGIAVTIGVFFVIFGFILTQIDVVNPYTGIEQSVFSAIVGWLLPF